MTVGLLKLALQLAMQLVTEFPKIRAAASTEDKAELDALYAEFRQASNGVADRLRETPDDPV